jgi:hypothetical protein
LSQAESLRLEHTSVTAKDAFEMGLLTNICNDLGSALDKGLDQVKQSTYGKSVYLVSFRERNEISLWCYDDALAQWHVENKAGAIVH